MITLLATTLLASFAGSLHCAGMCGPLLALVQGGRSSRALHAAYQGGRLSVYGLLGAGAGALGHGVESVAAAKGLEHAALVTATLALIFAAVTPALRNGHGRTSAGLQAMRAALGTTTPLARAGLFGAATGLMPCGWLYAWLAVAAAAGSALTGGLVMVGFGLGSVPALVATNTVLAKTSNLLRRRSRRLAPLLLVASAIAVLAIRGAVIDRLHDALDAGSREDAPLVCHGG
ncbi:MAG: sulfite exporter TauE/SafE family protein [Myxococcota bacterium]